MGSTEVTSASPLELTRRAFASPDYDAMMKFLGPDSVWDISRWGLGTHTGPAAIRRHFDDWVGSFDEYEITLDEVSDLGGGVVYAVASQHARPAGGQSHISLRHASVFVWEKEVAVRVTHYRDLDEARADAERLASERS